MKYWRSLDQGEREVIRVDCEKLIAFKNYIE